MEIASFLLPISSFLKDSKNIGRRTFNMSITWDILDTTEKVLLSRKRKIFISPIWKGLASKPNLKLLVCVIVDWCYLLDTKWSVIASLLYWCLWFSTFYPITYGNMTNMRLIFEQTHKIKRWKAWHRMIFTSFRSLGSKALTKSACGLFGKYFELLIS